jgi:DNA invertase Pin-like site-specific DNA recombinase
MPNSIGDFLQEFGGIRMEKTATASPNPHLPARAAQYVRMSTEHQLYSPENQLEVIRQYAASHGMEIVPAYSDHGRSGLNIAGREGLNRLMSDVENKQANFSALLVYDVSRWGRFQDVDESAYSATASFVAKVLAGQIR